MKKRVFIVGHIGAGKGLLAKALAEKLGWDFFDADIGLEALVGKPISEIKKKEGEQAFYDCQYEILKSLLNKDKVVVTTDTSVVCSEKNRQLLSKEFTVNLKVSTPVQLERLGNKLNKEFLETLHKQRDPLFEKVASLSISSDDAKLDHHIESVIKALEK